MPSVPRSDCGSIEGAGGGLLRLVQTKKTAPEPDDSLARIPAVVAPQRSDVESEPTEGDCHEVGNRIRALREVGILPNDDPVWTDVDAQIVFVSDGSEWLLEHIVPLLPFRRAEEMLHFFTRGASRSAPS